MRWRKALKVGVVVCAVGLGVVTVYVWAKDLKLIEKQQIIDSLTQKAFRAYQNGENNRAIALLTQSLDIDPQQIEVYIVRAGIYSTLDQTVLAMADYRQAITLDPKNAGAYGGMGWELILNGRFEEAREVTEKAHALEPDEFTWLINLGDLALLAGDRERARTYYLRGLEQIRSEEEFEKAPIADLELFIQKGWAVDAARQELAWLQKTYSCLQEWRNLNQQFELAYRASDYSTAEKVARTALEIIATGFGSDHPYTATSLSNLYMALQKQNRFFEAAPLLRLSLRKFLDPGQPETADRLETLALMPLIQGRYDEAEEYYRRALAIREKAVGPDHPETTIALEKLASVLRAQDRYAEAETLARRALAIREIDSGHPAIAFSLQILAEVLQAQGRLAEAEPLLRRALDIREKALGPDDSYTATTLNQLAMLYHDQGRHADAEPLYQRARMIYEKADGLDHPNVANSLNNLAALYGDQGRYADAEHLDQRALAILEKALGPDHPAVATSLNSLAVLYDTQGQHERAEPLYRRAVAIVQKTDTPTQLLLYNRNLGYFLVQRGQLRDALPHYRAAADALDRLFGQTRGLSEEARLTFLGQYAYVYREFLDLLLKLHERDAQAGYDREFLAVASRNQSRIFSELLRQGDVNRLAADPAFVALKERRESLLSQLADLRKQRATIPAGAIPIRDLRVESQKADLDQRINALAIVLQSVEDRLWRYYPRFMELLAIPRPVTVEQLQQELLRPGEALLGVVLLPERAAVLAVTRDRFALHVAPLTAAEVGRRVAAIRAGLQPPRPGDPIRVETLERLDPADLHALYRDLIAPVEPILKDAGRVLAVADGPLYGLPLELLVTDHDDARQAAFRAARSASGRPGRPPLLSAYAGLPYLADRHAFRYLPSLAALASQRRYPKPAVPTARPLVAFADPVFDPRDAADPASTGGHTPATRQALALLTRSGAAAGPLARLPETADEARALAAALPGDSRLYLRQDAQERTLKDLSRAGDLKGLRYLLLATHGLLAGEFRPPEPPPDPKALLDPDRLRRPAPAERLGQPALALTLAPALPDEDGFLNLKDVIEDLDLGAELVILSACNTAGDPAKTDTGEGFAGLARAFLFAGARHLWVSHWPVESAAARDLIAEAVRAREAGQSDPAAALAQAQKKIRDTDAPFDLRGESRRIARAHPFFWAPFVTVGD